MQYRLDPYQSWLIIDYHSALEPILTDFYQSLQSSPMSSEESIITRAASQKETRNIDIVQLAAFMSACNHLLPEIRQGWRDERQNETLPANVVQYLTEYLKLTSQDIGNCWTLMKHDIFQGIGDNIKHLTSEILTSVSSVEKLWQLKLGKYSSISADSFI